MVAADLKLLNVLLGLSSHSGKFACIYCEGEIGMESGRLRTFGSCVKNNMDYVASGSKSSTMQRYFNCINMPLLRMDSDMEVMDALPPPELHLMMGAVNLQLEVIYNYLVMLGQDEMLWAWCSQHGITRRGMCNEILN